MVWLCRAHEQERWAKKLANSQEQLANATEDARLQAQKYVGKRHTPRAYLCLSPATAAAAGPTPMGLWFCPWTSPHSAWSHRVLLCCVGRYAIESQKRCAEHLTAVKASEEQYIALQAEHAELHDLLKVRELGWTGMVRVGSAMRAWRTLRHWLWIVVTRTCALCVQEVHSEHKQRLESFEGA